MGGDEILEVSAAGEFPSEPDWRRPRRDGTYAAHAGERIRRRAPASEDDGVWDTSIEEFIELNQRRVQTIVLATLIAVAKHFTKSRPLVGHQIG